MKLSLKKLFAVFLCTLLTVVFCFLTGKAFGFSSFTFCWVLNFLLMAWYTYITSKFPLNLNSSYFQQKEFEKDGVLYEYLGVRIFKKLLIWTGWEKIQRKKYSNQKKAIALKRLEHDTRASETGHAVIAVIVFGLAAVFSESLTEAKWFLLTNLLLNIYPIMLQRYNRPRFQRLLAKMNPKDTFPARRPSRQSGDS